MRAIQIDPRSVSVIHSRPSYRVYFWAHDGFPTHAWESDEWQLSQADDVVEVQTWANRRAAGRSYELFVEVGDGLGGVAAMVRLAGSNPTECRD